MDLPFHDGWHWKSRSTTPDLWKHSPKLPNQSICIHLHCNWKTSLHFVSWSEFKVHVLPIHNPNVLQGQKTAWQMWRCPMKIRAAENHALVTVLMLVFPILAWLHPGSWNITQVETTWMSFRYQKTLSLCAAVDNTTNIKHDNDDDTKLESRLHTGLLFCFFHEFHFGRWTIGWRIYTTEW